MLEYKLGYFATSLCGHDKGRSLHDCKAGG